MSHLEHHNVLTRLNHGFRSGFSGKTQLFTTTHDLLTSFGTGEEVDIAIVDFSKAFDMMPHKKPLHKLDRYGVRGPLPSGSQPSSPSGVWRLCWKASPLTRSLWSLQFPRAQTSVQFSFFLFFLSYQRPPLLCDITGPALCRRLSCLQRTQ